MNIRKIAQEEIETLSKAGAGMYCEYGFCGSESGEILIKGNAGWFAVSEKDYFNHDGFFVSPKTELLLAIGGLTKSSTEILAEKLKISHKCACDVRYLRTRSRWTQELENKLIQLHAEGKRPNMNEFGSSSETQAKLYWKAVQRWRSFK